MNKPVRRLPDAELEVMQALWQCEYPAPRVEIEKYLFPTHPMALTTLLTLLTRLAEKDFIKIEKKDRRSYYTPLVSQQEYLAGQSRTFFEKLCGGNISVFANALQSSGISREELAQLRSLLESEDI